VAKATAKFEPEGKPSSFLFVFLPFTLGTELTMVLIPVHVKVFRDALLSHLLPIPSNEYDTIATKLITAGSTLEFLKYSDALFEIVFVGGILQPGGSYVDDEKTTRSPFAIIGGKDEIEGTSAGEGADWKDVLAEVRHKTDVLGKVIMRFVPYPVFSSQYSFSRPLGLTLESLHTLGTNTFRSPSSRTPCPLFFNSQSLPRFSPLKRINSS
jgi:hypothetical protein